MEHETTWGQHTHETPPKVRPTSQHHCILPQSMNDTNNVTLHRTYLRRSMEGNPMTSLMVIFFSFPITILVQITQGKGDRGRVAQWLRCCATNRKVAGSIPTGVIEISHLHKILALGSTQPLTEMSTRSISWR